MRNTDLDSRLELVKAIDQTLRNSCPDNWRGNIAKENLIKQALLPVLNYDEDEIERLFPIIVAQSEY